LSSFNPKVHEKMRDFKYAGDKYPRAFTAIAREREN
jgi:hypothetical protein